MEASGQFHALDILHKTIAPSTYWIGSWVAPEPVGTLRNIENSLAPARAGTPAFQPAARRYTD
jgi:hypothetical protein